MLIYIQAVAKKDYEYGHFKKGDNFDFEVGSKYSVISINDKELEDNQSWTFCPVSFHTYFKIISVTKSI